MAAKVTAVSPEPVRRGAGPAVQKLPDSWFAQGGLPDLAALAPAYGMKLVVAGLFPGAGS